MGVVIYKLKQMATILKCEERDFREEPNKIDPFRLLSDVSRRNRSINPVNLNFDLRLLCPGNFSAPYHFHRFAEELFLVISGSMTLRSPDGLAIVHPGDMVFFEMGDTGAHQFFNHSTEPCTYLDVRTSVGYDVCEYPDSGKVLLAPSFEIFGKEAKLTYFEGEESIRERWANLENESDKAGSI